MSLETDRDDDTQQTAPTEDAAPASSIDEPMRESGDGTVAVAADDSASIDADDSASIDADGFGVKGWALTGVLFMCVVVIPGIIYAYPYAAGGLGFTFFATYLALPLVPAALLGLVAVWSMTAAVADS